MRFQDQEGKTEHVIKLRVKISKGTELRRLASHILH
jgi:hypothetical protein